MSSCTCAKVLSRSSSFRSKLQNGSEAVSALVHNTKNSIQIYLTTAGIGLNMLVCGNIIPVWYTELRCREIVRCMKFRQTRHDVDTALYRGPSCCGLW